MPTKAEGPHSKCGPSQHANTLSSDDAIVPHSSEPPTEKMGDLVHIFGPGGFDPSALPDDAPRIDAREIRARLAMLSPDELAGLFGLTLRRGRCPCPMHDGRDDNLSIFQGRDCSKWCCHVEHVGGDALALIAAMAGLDASCDFPAVLDAAARLLGLGHGDGLTPAQLDALEAERHERACQRRAKEDLDNAALAAELGRYFASQELGGDALPFLRQLGLAPLDFRAAVSMGMVQHDRAAMAAELTRLHGYGGLLHEYPIVTPIVAGPVAVGAHCRALYRRPGEPKTKALGRASMGLLGGFDLGHTSGPVILCEGDKDTLAARIYLADLGLAVGTVGAGVSPKQAQQLAGRHVLIAYDADDAGDQGSEKSAALLRRHGCTVQRLRPPDGLDLAEWLAGQVAA